MPWDAPKWDPRRGLRRKPYTMDESEVRSFHPNGLPFLQDSDELPRQVQRAESRQPVITRGRVSRVGMFANAKSSAVVIVNPDSQRNVDRAIRQIVAPEEEDPVSDPETASARRRSTDDDEPDIDTSPIRHNAQRGLKRAHEGHVYEERQRMRDKYRRFLHDDNSGDQGPPSNSARNRTTPYDSNYNKGYIYLEGYNMFESGYRPIYKNRFPPEPKSASTWTSCSRVCAPPISRHANSFEDSILPSHTRKPFAPPISRQSNSHGSANYHHYGDPEAPLQRQTTNRGPSGKKYDVEMRDYNEYDRQTEGRTDSSKRPVSDVKQSHRSSDGKMDERSRSSALQDNSSHGVHPRTISIRERVAADQASSENDEPPASTIAIRRLLSRTNFSRLPLNSDGSGRYAAAAADRIYDSILRVVGNKEAKPVAESAHIGDMLLNKEDDTVAEGAPVQQHEHLFEIDTPYFEEIASSPPPTPELEKIFSRKTAKAVVIPVKEQRGRDPSHDSFFRGTGDHDRSNVWKDDIIPTSTGTVDGTTPITIMGSRVSPPSKFPLDFEKLLMSPAEESTNGTAPHDGSVRKSPKAGSSMAAVSTSSTDNFFQKIEEEMNRPPEKWVFDTRKLFGDPERKSRKKNKGNDAPRPGADFPPFRPPSDLGRPDGIDFFQGELAVGSSRKSSKKWDSGASFAREVYESLDLQQKKEEEKAMQRRRQEEEAKTAEKNVVLNTNVNPHDNKWVKQDTKKVPSGVPVNPAIASRRSMAPSNVFRVPEPPKKGNTRLSLHQNTHNRATDKLQESAREEGATEDIFGLPGNVKSHGNKSILKTTSRNDRPGSSRGISSMRPNVTFENSLSTQVLLGLEPPKKESSRPSSDQAVDQQKKRRQEEEAYLDGLRRNVQSHDGNPVKRKAEKEVPGSSTGASSIPLTSSTRPPSSTFYPGVEPPKEKTFRRSHQQGSRAGVMDKQLKRSREEEAAEDFFGFLNARSHDSCPTVKKARQEVPGSSSGDSSKPSSSRLSRRTTQLIPHQQQSDGTTRSSIQQASHEPAVAVVTNPMKEKKQNPSSSRTVTSPLAASDGPDDFLMQLIAGKVEIPQEPMEFRWPTQQ